LATDCPKCSAPIPDGDAFCRACGEPADPAATAVTRAMTGDEETQAPRSPMELYLTEALGTRYRVEGLLGRGGMGAVYRATDTMLDRQVAIKVLPPELAHDEGFASRFEREARTAAKLDHPGIIPIYSVEHTRDISFFIMKFVRGRGLDRIIVEDAPLALDFCQRVVWESACALGHAHQRGVVHRDIKPANVLLDEEGRVLITDFGIAKATEAAGTQLTATGQVIGTPHYMSPEQAQGLPVSGASDQYSLAMAGYHMLTGKPPFATESLHAIIYKQIFEQPPSLREGRPDIPEPLAVAIERALAKDPAQRFPTMEAFATAVWPERPVRPASPAPPAPLRVSSGVPVTPTTAPPRPSPRRRPLRTVAGIAIAAAIGGSGLFWLGTRGRSATPGGATTAIPESAAVAPGSLAVRDAPPSDASRAPARPSVGDPAPPVTAARESAPPAAAPPRETAPPAAPPPRAETPAVGYLTIDARPFGRVFVDGVEIQDTPLVRHAVAPGAHIVEIRREGYRTVVDTVDVAAGGTARRSLTLSREGSE
jgi:eukaryotic-like serine/threonine-protein kinase